MEVTTGSTKAYCGLILVKKSTQKRHFLKHSPLLITLINNFLLSFISAGTGNPLQIQSHELVRKLVTLNVKVDTLFFAPGYLPSLPQEYQFNLDTDAGKKALEQSVQLLHNLIAVDNETR